jgi:hypothetical protein
VHEGRDGCTRTHVGPRVMCCNVVCVPKTLPMEPLSPRMRSRNSRDRVAWESHLLTNAPTATNRNARPCDGGGRRGIHVNFETWMRSFCREQTSNTRTEAADRAWASLRVVPTPHNFFNVQALPAVHVEPPHFTKDQGHHRACPVSSACRMSPVSQPVSLSIIVVSYIAPPPHLWSRLPLRG